MLPHTVVDKFRKCVSACVVLQRCLCGAVGEAACCMLFRHSHIVSRSDPAVKTYTYIHMHRLHAGRYLFRLQRHMIVHSGAHTVHEQERKENVYEYSICVYLVPSHTYQIQIRSTSNLNGYFVNIPTQSTIIIKDTVHSHPAPLCV